MDAAAKVTGERTFRLWLELDAEADPIVGTVTPPGRDPIPFTGWLGLAGALGARPARDASTLEGGAADGADEA